jgi:hypothetical protein
MAAPIVEIRRIRGPRHSGPEEDEHRHPAEGLMVSPRMDRP